MTQAAPRRNAYAEAGVDIDRAADFVRRIATLAASTRRPGAEVRIGGFGGVFDPGACGYRDPLLVATTDGVGTKLLLGRESGRLYGLGIDLVAMCVNDLLVQGAEPLFFLDYYATGRLEPARAEALVAGMAEACRLSGCALLGGETAEMPGLYRSGDFDLAGFAVGAVERQALLPRTVRPGDRILALASSGVHANGFSLVRKILRERGLKPADPAPFDRRRSLAEVLLEPTRIYVRSCLAAIRGGGVRAFAHITGGGLLENIPRVLPEDTAARLDLQSYELPAVFRWLAAEAGLDALELARTFNCGIGMVAIVAPEAEEEIRRELADAGERVWRVGEIVAGRGKPRVELIGVEKAWGFLASPS